MVGPCPAGPTSQLVAPEGEIQIQPAALFDWLRGDVGPDGRPRRLPVDACYESLRLVVEYRGIAARPAGRVSSTTARSTKLSGSSTKSSTRAVRVPASAGVFQPLFAGSPRKNGAPSTVSPTTPPKFHSSSAPSARLYHSAAAPALWTASMSEIETVGIRISFLRQTGSRTKRLYLIYPRSSVRKDKDYAQAGSFSRRLQLDPGLVPPTSSSPSPATIPKVHSRAESLKSPGPDAIYLMPGGSTRNLAVCVGSGAALLPRESRPCSNEPCGISIRVSTARRIAGQSIHPCKSRQPRGHREVGWIGG